MSIEFPSLEDVNRVRFDRMLQREAPHTLYVIFFTPRSGSTWLTDLCTQTGRLGKPGEHFSVKAVNNTARNRNVTSLDEYIAFVMRQTATDGVFGFETTLPQMMRTFESTERFESFFGKATAFWLTRTDVVSQALSIIKHKQTEVSHYRGVADDERARADEKFSYSEEAIRRASRNVVNMEKRTERYFRDRGITPIRFNYETMIATPPIDVANTVLRGIGKPELTTFAFEPALQRTGTAKNAEFAARFRASNADYLAELDGKRRAALALSA